MKDLFIVALKTYAAECRARAFADSMARMARDPDIRRECALINKEFLPTEADGLPPLGGELGTATNFCAPDLLPDCIPADPPTYRA